MSVIDHHNVVGKQRVALATSQDRVLGLRISYEPQPWKCASILWRSPKWVSWTRSSILMQDHNVFILGRHSFGISYPGLFLNKNPNLRNEKKTLILQNDLFSLLTQYPWFHKWETISFDSSPLFLSFHPPCDSFPLTSLHKLLLVLLYTIFINLQFVSSFSLWQVV
jgi:hypothetical protein